MMVQTSLPCSHQPQPLPSALLRSGRSRHKNPIADKRIVIACSLTLNLLASAVMWASYSSSASNALMLARTNSAGISKDAANWFASTSLKFVPVDDRRSRWLMR
jgi:hypothetical protein